MMNFLLIGSLRSPPPFRLRRTSPCSGGRIGLSMFSCRVMAPWLSIHSAPACGGKVVAPATKGGLHFQRPQGGCMVFAAKGGIRNGARRRRTSPAQRYYITPEGGALNPPVRRQPVPDRTLGAQGQRPGGAINPRGEAASTFGNTGKHRTGPDPDRDTGSVSNKKTRPGGRVFLLS